MKIPCPIENGVSQWKYGVSLRIQRPKTRKKPEYDGKQNKISIQEYVMLDRSKRFAYISQDDPTQRKPVINLAKKELDLGPVIPLEEGLKGTIEYLKTVVWEYKLFPILQRTEELKNAYPLPADDPIQRKPVIDLAKKELDWKPTISLDEGLKRTQHGAYKCLDLARGNNKDIKLVYSMEWWKKNRWKNLRRDLDPTSNILSLKTPPNPPCPDYLAPP